MIEKAQLLYHSPEAQRDADHLYYTKEIEKLQAEVLALHRMIIGEVWYWQPDDNHLESLICPVLIEAAQLRALLGVKA